MKSCSRLTMRLFIFFGITITLFVVNLFTFKFFINEPEIVAVNEENAPMLEEIHDELPEDTKIYSSLSFDSFKVDTIDNNKDDTVSWYYKSSTKTYYLLLPKAYDRNHLQVLFETDSPNALVTVYNKKKEKIGEFRNYDIVDYFNNDELTLKLETNVKKTKSYKVVVEQGSVSSVFINLENGNKDYQKLIRSDSHSTKASGSAVLIDMDNNVTTSNIEAMRGRGNTTWARAKKPFQIKFEKKTKVLSLGKGKSFNLVSNYTDGTLARTYSWLSFGKELEIPYNLDYETVDVYINNTYMGVYLITDKINVSKSSVDIEDTDFLFEIDNKIDNYQIRTNHGFVIKTHNPDLESMSKEERNKTLKEAKSYLNKVEKIIYNPKSTKEELESVIDLESFAKYYWVQEISENFDAIRGSNYMYVKDGILYAGPLWDLDATLNRSYAYTTANKYYVLSDQRLQNRLKANWVRGLMKNPVFSEMVDKIYIENQSTFNNILNNFNNFQEGVKSSIKMNYVRWNYQYMVDNYYNNNWVSSNKSYSGSVSYFKKMLKGRLSFYKGEYKKIMFDKFEYEIDGEVKEVELNKEVTIDEPKNAEVKIYGYRGNEKILIDTVEFKDGEVNYTLDFKCKVNNIYKTYNYYNYGTLNLRIRGNK